MSSIQGNILLVDDDEFFLAMLEDQLRSQGYTVRAFSDGVQALASAEVDAPDLVLLDIILPRMSGLEVLQIIKSRPQMTDVPVLMLTVERREEILLKGFHLGADDVLLKPVSNEELLARVEAALRRYRRLEQLKQVIQQNLDPSVAFRVLNQPAENLKLTRTHLAVLFSDLRGFTQMAERIEPEECARMLNGLFERLVRCVLRYGGTLDKFLGDGLMAIFGAPVSYPDNETRAVCAALEMVEELAALELPQMGRPDMGIGISAGEVVVGPLGSSLRANYTAIGDPVNVAARLTALSSGREIIVSQQVAERLDPRFQKEPLPPVTLKGKRQPLNIFRIPPGQKLEIALRRKV